MNKYRFCLISILFVLAFASIPLVAVPQIKLSVEAGANCSWLYDDYNYVKYSEDGVAKHVECTTLAGLGYSLGLGAQADVYQKLGIHSRVGYTFLSSRHKVFGLNDTVSFPSISASVLATYPICSNLTVELGPQCYWLLDEAKYSVSGQSYHLPNTRSQVWGAEAGFNYSYQQWQAGLYYTHSFEDTKTAGVFGQGYYPRSLQFTLGYQFYTIE